jgi:hypothetical protein
MKSERGVRVTLCIVAMLAVLAAAVQARAATIATDKSDYQPGETVAITGSGWQPGETVELFLQEKPQNRPERDWSSAADENGGFADRSFLVEERDRGVTFTLTVVGRASGQMAVVMFTDDNDTPPNCDAGPDECPDYIDPQTGLPREDPQFVPDATCAICGSDASGGCRLGCRHTNTNGNTDCHPVATHLVTNGTTCTDDNNSCTSDVCDGNGTCTHPAGNAGTECRASAGECDPAESCDGVSTRCPADQKTGAGVSCTDDGNVCTLDQCDGTSPTCQHPAGHAGTECRASAGECDPAESCDGVSTGCPADTKTGAGVSCTDDGSVCTLDQCNGTSAACQHPAGNAGVVCRTGSGDVCDPDEKCTGSSPTCPTDVVASSATVCRPANGECDAAEKCTGLPGQACPTDLAKPAGTSCTDDGTECTSDVCDGTQKTCTHPLQACSLVTDSSLCQFDVDSVLNTPIPNQFRLILTPDPNSPSTYKLNASNPGQYYYNIVYVGAAGASVNITVPYPFVTQGAVPIHIYDNVIPGVSGGDTCFAPGTEIKNYSQQITLASYGPNPTFTSTTTVTVTVPTPLPGGHAYINIHLDYGLKGEGGCVKAGTNLNDAACTTPSSVTVKDLQTYTFSDSTPGDDTVQSENAFKKNPGFGGFVQVNGSNDPVAGALVEIWDSSNKKVASLTTDQDAWYTWQYKYTGKAATFTVKLPKYGKSQSVTLKSNGFVVVNFTTPY